jgi:hypothetical protein
LFAIYDSKFKPVLFSRISYINIPELICKTGQDIKIANNWLPGNIREYKKGRLSCHRIY